MTKPRPSIRDTIAAYIAPNTGGHDLDGLAKELEAREESEWRDRDDLRKNWHAFCDADTFDGCADFADRMEAAGLVELQWLDDGEAQATVEADPFWAAKFGDQMPSSIYVLTDLGRRTLSDRPSATP